MIELDFNSELNDLFNETYLLPILLELYFNPVDMINNINMLSYNHYHDIYYKDKSSSIEFWDDIISKKYTYDIITSKFHLYIGHSDDSEFKLTVELIENYISYYIECYFVRETEPIMKEYINTNFMNFIEDVITKFN